METVIHVDEWGKGGPYRTRGCVYMLRDGMVRIDLLNIAVMIPREVLEQVIADADRKREGRS